VQKKGWLGNNSKFIQNYIKTYNSDIHKNGIYQELLCPLFFQALNSAPSQKNKFSFPNITEPFNTQLVNAPYLNGGLFRKHENYDLDALYITDEAINNFTEFLFSYNFTLEENTLYDEELELNPEFLGIIFEKLINKQYGAIYTPRLEVDFMCRISLVKYLQKNCSSSIKLEELYKLFFPEYGDENEQTAGNFSFEEAKEILEKLEQITICDPAIGSGAFAVGMLSVLDEIECLLYEKFLHQETPSNPFERKKRIIFQSLYGVEVKQWAVWITQLRLWITLLIDAEDNLKNSEEPLLPSFDFKIRQGDSLIQILGNYLFPISGEGLVGLDIQRKIKELIKLKTDYYYNKCSNKQFEIEKKQQDLYLDILLKKRNELNAALKRLERDSINEVQDNFLDSDIQIELDLSTKKQKHEIEKLKYQINIVEYEIKQIMNHNLPFIWIIDFPEIFIENRGFDIVIGNPPYVPQEEIEDPLNKIERSKYKALLKTMVAQDFPQDLQESNINGKSDLYTFFYIRGLRLLNPKGILTFISSNSWLDVEFGAWLQKFLLENCPVYFIIDNLSKRVFRSADINTIIAVIGAKQKMVASDDLIRFAAFKLPFESSLYTENFLTIEETQNRIDYDDLRVNPVPRIKLLEEGLNNSRDNKYIGNMWGSYYIRSPHFFLNILEKCENKLVNLNKVAVIKGYIHDNSVSDKYPTKYFVKSVKDINVLGVDTNTPGVIRKGIKSTNGNDIIAPILYPRTFGSRHIVIRNLSNVFFKEFYKIIPIEEENVDSIFIQLNSSFGVFQRELIGLSNLGGGALKFSINSIGLFRFFTKIEYKDYCDILEPLLTEKVDDFFVECNKSYRIELDDIIFNYLGLTKDERRIFMDILKDMIENRLNRASSC